MTAAKLIHALLLSVALLLTHLAEAQERHRNYPRDWWPEFMTRPDAWFASDQGRRVANNILSWQDASGGWPLMQTINEPWTGDERAVGPWGRRGALIKSTVNEIRFLARSHRATGDSRYLNAAVGGIDFILAAQWPSGGWPHSYPHFRSPYDRYVTFNDDEMTDLLRLLREVGNDPLFAGLSDDRRSSARTAFANGLDFILKSQITVGNKPTVWAQQYDEVTLEPRSARPFEPVALTAGESAGVLLLLMSIQEPTPAIERAVHAGASWYEQVKIEGMRVERTPDDRTVHADASATPVWARFYEIGTNRPIFAGRDGVIRYQLEQIEQERRAGYAWYGSWGTEVLEQYTAWKRTRR